MLCIVCFFGRHRFCFDFVYNLHAESCGVLAGYVWLAFCQIMCLYFVMLSLLLFCDVDINFVAILFVSFINVVRICLWLVFGCVLSPLCACIL